MTHHESPVGDNDPFRGMDELQAILERDRDILEVLTASADPLTAERLMTIDPRFGSIAEDVRETELQWPDDSSSVVASADAQIRKFSGEEGNWEFIKPMFKQGSSEYNNFFLRIGTPHSYPSETILNDFLQKADDLTLLVYGTKVYVERAHRLLPDFMNELQKATAEVGAMQSWTEAMCLGHFDPDEYPDNRVLLDATRFAYVLLGQLMRKDDYKIQKALLRMPTEGSSEILDPDSELRS